MVHSCGITTKHRFDKGSAFADGNRGQGHAVGNIAHGKNRGDVGLRILIHQDLPLAARLHTRRFQAQLVGIGDAAGCVKHLVEFIDRAIGAFHPQAGFRLFDRHDIGAHMQVDPLGDHLVGNMAPHLVVKAAQDLRAPIELRDLRAQPVENAGKFTGNIPATHDQNAPRLLFKQEDVVRGDDQIGPRKIGHEGPATHGNKNVLGGQHLARGQPHRMRVFDDRACVEQLDPGVFQVAPIDAFKARDLVANGADQPPPVKTGRAHIPAETGGVVECLGKTGGKNHQLFRHAAANHAGAAHAVFFGKAHLVAIRSGQPRGPDTTGAPADDEKVKVKSHMSVRYIDEKIVALDHVDLFMLDRAHVDVTHLDMAIAMADYNGVADIKEKPVFHHARNLVHDERQLSGLGDAPQVEVENIVPLVGDKGPVAIHAQRARTAQDINIHQRLFDQGLGGFPAETDDFDRQRESTQIFDLFRGIGNDHHAIGCRGNDLFLQQGTAAALDQVEVVIEFIRAVDGQVQPFHLFQGRDRHANILGQLRGAVRGRHPDDLEPLFTDHLAQDTNHPGGGRARPQPKPHAGFNVIQRTFGRNEFCRVDR